MDGDGVVPIRGASLTEELTYKFHGAAADMMVSDAKELLCESGAGTGKSFSILVKAYLTAIKNPGSRQLFLRQTRKSLNDSILPMWRDKILGNGHPAIRATSTIPYQDNYRFPNASEIVIGGLEDADRILSAEYDRIYVFQAEETNIEAYEKALTRLRHKKTPYHQMVLDVNPASRYHWINKRFDRSLCIPHKRERLSYRHQDNPLLFDHLNDCWTDWGKEYVTEILGALTGVRRERLLFHRWVAEEGIILETFDSETHCITAELEAPSKRDPVWHLHVKDQNTPIDLCYFTAGVDWGWDPDPGVMQVWGYDSPRWHPNIRRFRVAEIYRTRWQREEWAEAAVDLWAKYDIRFFSCDRSRPDSIAYFNTRLGVHTGRNAPQIALGQPSLGGVRVPGKGEIYNGIDLMREGLFNPVTKHVRTFFVNDSLLDGPDPALVKAGRPTKTEDEILEWVYTRIKEDDPKKETLPDPKCDEHGCFVAGTLLSTPNGPRPVEAFRAGDVLDTAWGPRAIDRAGLTREDAELMELRLSNGTSIKATPDHEFWTSRGWLALRRLVIGDTMLSWKELKSSRCMRSSTSTESSGDATRNLHMRHRGGTSSATRPVRSGKSTYTDMCGELSVGQSPKAFTFTTSIATQPTTTYPTWSASPLETTRLGIRSGVGLRKTWRAFVRWLRSGIGPKRGGRGTGNTQSGSGGSANWLARNVRNADLHSRVPGCELSTAPLRASSAPSTVGTLTTTTVTGLRSLSETNDVYCVREPDTGTVIADGIVAGQCDAWRYDEALNYIKGYGKRAPKTKTFKQGTYGEQWVKQLKRGLDGLPKGLRRRRKQRVVLPKQLQGG